MAGRTFKRIELNIDEGGCFIRTPDKGSAGADSDDMTMVVYGQKPSGQWVQVEAIVNRAQVLGLAEKLWHIIDLEEAKVAKMKRAMLRQS